MNKNVRIAKQLIKVAKNLVASDSEMNTICNFALKTYQIDKNTFEDMYRQLFSYDSTYIEKEWRNFTEDFRDWLLGLDGKQRKFFYDYIMNN